MKWLESLLARILRRYPNPQDVFHDYAMYPGSNLRSMTPQQQYAGTRWIPGDQTRSFHWVYDEALALSSLKQKYNGLFEHGHWSE
jgi:hypothetical protein